MAVTAPTAAARRLRAAAAGVAKPQPRPQPRPSKGDARGRRAPAVLKDEPSSGVRRATVAATLQQEDDELARISAALAHAREQLDAIGRRTAAMQRLWPDDGTAQFLGAPFDILSADLPPRGREQSAAVAGWPAELVQAVGDTVSLPAGAPRASGAAGVGLFSQGVHVPVAGHPLVYRGCNNDPAFRPCLGVVSALEPGPKSEAVVGCATERWVASAAPAVSAARSGSSCSCCTHEEAIDSDFLHSKLFGAGRGDDDEASGGEARPSGLLDRDVSSLGDGTWPPQASMLDLASRGRSCEPERRVSFSDFESSEPQQSLCSAGASRQPEQTPVLDLDDFMAVAEDDLESLDFAGGAAMEPGCSGAGAELSFADLFAGEAIPLDLLCGGGAGWFDSSVEMLGDCVLIQRPGESAEGVLDGRRTDPGRTSSFWGARGAASAAAAATIQTESCPGHIFDLDPAGWAGGHELEEEARDLACSSFVINADQTRGAAAAAACEAPSQRLPAAGRNSSVNMKTGRRVRPGAPAAAREPAATGADLPAAPAKPKPRRQLGPGGMHGAVARFLLAGDS